MNNDSEHKIDIENVLCSKIRPTFLVVTDPDLDPDGDIQVLVSTIAFGKMTIEERVRSVFRLLKHYCPDILETRLVIVQAHTMEEIEQILEEVFQDDE